MTEQALKYGVISVGLVALVLTFSVLVLVAQGPGSRSASYSGAKALVAETGSTNTATVQSVTISEPDATRATVTVSQ